MTGELAAMSGARLSVGAVREGWYCIDNRGGNGADLTIDLECYPWPLPDSCAVQAFAGHVVNRINPARWGFVLFMNELWRLLVPNGELMIVSYYGTNSRYAADPAACNAISEQTLFYFDPAHKSGLWQVYQPQPWQILSLSWAADGNLEAVLAKR
jgi:hypothetical protein